MITRDLHGITDRGNRGITAVKSAVMGSHFYRGSSGNGDSFLGISIDYRGKTAVSNGDNFSSITAVVVVMRTKHCVWGGNGDDFLSPCSSLVITQDEER